MKRLVDQEKLENDIRKGILRALKTNGVDSSWSVIAVGAVLQAFASEFKWAMVGPPLLKDAGNHAFTAWTQSRLAYNLATVQSQDSLIVSPLMEAIVRALKQNGSPMPDALLQRDALRIQLAMPKLTVAGLPKTLVGNPSLTPAYASAMGYLAEAQIIRRCEDGASWELNEV